MKRCIENIVQTLLEIFEFEGSSRIFCTKRAPTVKLQKQFLSTVNVKYSYKSQAI